MTIPVITFFNNKGGVGKTSLVFHLAWMLSKMGQCVIAMDLDPQANLTSAFLPEDELEEVWLPKFLQPNPSSSHGNTIYQCVQPLTEVGDILKPQTKEINPNLFLVPGDLALAGFEDFLSQEWPNALGSQTLYRPFRILSSFWQVAQVAAAQHQANLVLVDVGPNLGAINRSALIGTDHLIIPLAADLFSLQGLRNLGPTLEKWQKDWNKRINNWENSAFPLPAGKMQPLGYILMQHSERLSRPVKAYDKWADKIPATYCKNVLRKPVSSTILIPDDVHCLARLKHYRSLVPLAQAVNKPIFQLTSADGAIGSHANAVSKAEQDFLELALAILEKMRLSSLGF